MYQKRFLKIAVLNFTLSIHSHRQAWVNSVDYDHVPLNTAFDQGLHCLSLIQQFVDTSTEYTRLVQILVVW